jgi:hypothetical protein
MPPAFGLRAVGILLVIDVRGLLVYNVEDKGKVDVP